MTWRSAVQRILADPSLEVGVDDRIRLEAALQGMRPPSDGSEWMEDPEQRERVIGLMRDANVALFAEVERDVLGLPSLIAQDTWDSALV